MLMGSRKHPEHPGELLPASTPHRAAGLVQHRAEQRRLGCFTSHRWEQLTPQWEWELAPMPRAGG